MKDEQDLRKIILIIIMNKFVILFCSIIFGMSASLTYVSASCAQNTDWQEAPCFDVLPVNREEYRTAWEPYHEYKGSEWMEQKKADLLLAIEDGTFMEWEGNAENSNVYQYYHSIGLVPNQYEYFFFEDDFRYYLQFSQAWVIIIIVFVVSLSAICVLMTIRKKMKAKFLMMIGIAMMIMGFSISVYSTNVLSQPSTPPLMRAIEGRLDYVFLTYHQVFLFSGIAGVFVTIAGIVMFWRRGE